MKAMRLLSEILQIGREGTWAGALRYVRFKSLGSVVAPIRKAPSRPDQGFGIVGAGTYAASVHLPCLRALGEPVYAVTSRSGNSARNLARVYGIPVVHETFEQMIDDRLCEALLVATPHYLHPDHILAVLRSDRYAYCEKPVAIDAMGLERLANEGLGRTSTVKIMVGFNRRFAPAVVRLRGEPWLLRRDGPLEMQYRVNFGPRANNAMSDLKVGGGRIHGAACHYVDLMGFLAGAPIVRVSAMALSKAGAPDDNTFAAVMNLADGSVASLAFTSEGRREFDNKEELTVTCGGNVARIANYSDLFVCGRHYRFRRHSYGAMNAWRGFLAAKRSGAGTPVGLADGIAATRVTLAMQESLRKHGEPVRLPRP